MTNQADSPLHRYARILEALAASPEGMTLTRIAEAARLHTGATHRLLNSLSAAGLAARQDGRKTYVLGARLLHLCHLALTPPSVVGLAEADLHELARAYGETAFLAKLTGDVVESVAMEVPRGGNKAYVQPGRVMPLYAAASAKAIFAFQPPEVIDRLLAEPRVRFTTETKLDESTIRAELHEVRAGRFAVCDDELDPGVLSYAVPVLPSSGRVIYAIGLCGLAERFRATPRADVRRSLLGASDNLAKKLERVFALD